MTKGPKESERSMKDKKSKKQPEKLLKRPHIRNLTPSEIESLMEDMKKAGQQVEGRSRHLPQNKKPR
jgi:hypothetical protein